MEQKDDYHDMLDGPFIPEEFEGTDEPMRPPPLDGEYDSSEGLLGSLNAFTKRQGYAVNITETGRSTAKVKNKVYIDCTRGKKPKNTSTDQRNAASKRID